MTDERAPLPEALSRPDPGRVLLIVPHADDDIIGAGGSAAMHVEQGDPVRVVVFYDGVAGDPDGKFDPDELRRMRQREARAGGVHLGLSDYDFWGYPEGHLPGAPDIVAVVRRMAAYLDEWKPDVIYAPWVGEYHVDHHVLARLVRGAIHCSGWTGAAWGFEVWTPLVPTRIVDITDVYPKKIDALKEHASQLAYTDHIHCALGMQAHRSLYLPGDARYGEAFRPLGPPGDEDREILAAV